MVLALSLPAGETNLVTLQLKNGDRLTGEVLSETADRIVLSTPWNLAIFVPKSAIQNQVAVHQEAEDVSAADKARPPGKAVTASSPDQRATQHDEASGAPASVLASKSAAASESPGKAKEPKHWKWNLKMGLDYLSGVKDRQIYSVQTGITYTRNYRSNPRKFLRNKIDYGLQYGETDGDISANSMVVANKLDFDVFGDFYGYGSVGSGYDRVRKIEYQVEVGPGLGYHLIADKTVALDTELGLNYQYREGLDGAPNREVIQARIAQELTWEVLSKITLTESVAFLPFLDEPGQYQLRVGGNVGFGIVRHLSLNLTVVNLYDTQPAPGVPNNDFQLRSSLGVNF
jgi:putative salt-induced outer membrane protein YdiY